LAAARVANERFLLYPASQVEAAGKQKRARLAHLPTGPSNREKLHSRYGLWSPYLGDNLLRSTVQLFVVSLAVAPYGWTREPTGSIDCESIY
jgi:hypothetical protein